MQLEGYTRVCSISEIKESDSKSFNVDDTPVLICHTNKGYFAIENKCSHQTAELEGGKIRSCFIFCPLHGQRFDLRNGKPIGKITNKPLRTFLLKLEEKYIWVNLESGV
jgi:3-phenylpropionate/trans-cinnamate dioxygenase ferredoxin subunit